MNILFMQDYWRVSLLHRMVTSKCYELYTINNFTVGCPVVDPDSFGICPEDCSSDSDCTNGQLCCSNGCGHVCMEPVPTDPCAVSNSYSYNVLLMI